MYFVLQYCLHSQNEWIDKWIEGKLKKRIDYLDGKWRPGWFYRVWSGKNFLPYIIPEPFKGIRECVREISGNSYWEKNEPACGNPVPNSMPFFTWIQMSMNSNVVKFCYNVFTRSNAILLNTKVFGKWQFCPYRRNFINMHHQLSCHKKNPKKPSTRRSRTNMDWNQLCAFNPSRSSDVYIRPHTRASFDQIMTCHLFGAKRKPLSELMLSYC